MAREQHLLPSIARKSPLYKVVVSGVYGNSDEDANIFIKENHPTSIVQIEIKPEYTDVFFKISLLFLTLFSKVKLSSNLNFLVKYFGFGFVRTDSLCSWYSAKQTLQACSRYS